MRVPPIVLTVLNVALLFILPIAGGLFNRIRGGWSANDFPSIIFFLGHDSINRLIFAIPTGLLAIGLCRRRHGLLIGLALMVYTFFSLYIGWGTYFGMARGNFLNTTRPGCFDWMLGRDEPGWTFWRRWSRVFTGMSLRGLASTAIPGYIMYLYGYGPFYLVAGASMGFIYEIANDIPIHLANFEQGSALGEFLWGYWTWLILAASMLTYRTQNAGESYWLPLPVEYMSRARPLVRKLGRFLVHVGLVLFEVIMIVSCVFYGFVQQSDMQNKDATWFGVITVTSNLIILHVVALLVRWQLVRVMRASHCSEHEAAEELRARWGCRRPFRWRPVPAHDLETAESEDEISAPFKIKSNSIQDDALSLLQTPDAPQRPFVFVLYSTAIVSALVLVFLLPLIPYVGILDAYSGSWHA